MERIILIGTAYGWNESLGRQFQEDEKVWGINSVIRWRHVHLGFHMHDLDKLNIKETAAFQGMISRINKDKIPLYSVKEYPYIPTSMRYPIEDISAHFNTGMFFSGFDYIMAMAIMQEPKVIEIYGVYMTMEDEYFFQKPSFMFWCGQARGRGIEIIDHGGHLFKSPFGKNKMYGFESNHGVE